MKALSSNHCSHDQQVADVLAWLRAEHPGDYAAIVDRFPEIPTAIFDGAWYDYELMGVDVEWSSWLTCVLEDTGLVQWEEGEPWAIPAPPTDDAVRLAHGHPGPLRWVEEWLIIGSVVADLPETWTVGDTYNDAEVIAQAVWDSTMAAHCPDEAILDACNLISVLGMVPEDERHLLHWCSPWTHDGTVVLAHADGVARWADEGADVCAHLVALAEQYPIADEELLTYAEDAYINIIADHNAPDWEDVDLRQHGYSADDVQQIWRAAWERERYECGNVGDVWVEPSAFHEWTRADVADLVEWWHANVSRNYLPAWAECGPERHEWGPVEHATMTGTPHRKCIYCRAITLDLDEVEA